MQLDADANVEHTWSTLVNPQRDLGPRSIHGITSRELLDAPTFADLIGDLADLVAGRHLVAHNARFDLAFLAAELERCGLDGPVLQGLCTLELAGRARLRGGRRLADCCAALGIEHHNAHTALGDALATAGLLKAFVRALPDSCESMPSPAEIVASAPPCGRTVARSTPWEAGPDEFLSDLIYELSPMPPSTARDPGAAMAYAELLDRCVEDRRLTGEERRGLAVLATNWGLTAVEVGAVHTEYLRVLVTAALADHVLSPAELEDLACVASHRTPVACRRNDRRGSAMRAVSTATRHRRLSIADVQEVTHHKNPEMVLRYHRRANARRTSPTRKLFGITP